MGWLSRWFGQCGKIRYDFELTDGRKGTGKTYIETFAYDNDMLETKLKDIVAVETE